MLRRRTSRELVTPTLTSTALEVNVGAASAPAPVPLRTFLRPRWLALHLIFLILVAACILLGRWQLSVSNRRHFDLQNFGYALQYCAFCCFIIFFWIRTIRDKRRPAHSEDFEQAQTLTDEAGSTLLVAPSQQGQVPVMYRGYKPPTTATALVPSHGDAYHDAYNNYLWQLNADHKRHTGPERKTIGQVNRTQLEPGTMNPDEPKQLPG